MMPRALLVVPAKAGTQYTQVVRPALQWKVRCLLDPRMRGDDKQSVV